MKIIRLLLISTLFFTSFFLRVHAESMMTLSMDPEDPTPRSPITLNLVSYYFDVNTARITWTVNKKQVLSGIGEKELTLTTGGVGEAITVRVTAQNSQGVSEEQTMVIVPSSVSLIYEAPRSYVPHFYEGRSLPADGALVRVTAIPQISEGGRMLPGSAFAYAWYVNDLVVSSVSGYGKQSADLHIDYLRDETEVKVIVKSTRGSTATKTITIVPHQPLPLLYSYDPILGTDFTKLIQSRFEAIKDFAVTLEPFYLSSKEKSSDDEPLYQWYLDNLPSTPLGGRILAFQVKENTYGVKKLRVSVTGPNKFLQTAETNTELIFDSRK